jgi:hypothetical protein
MSRHRERTGETVISVTSAQPGRSEDLDSRIVRYAWMMSIRIVCFVLANAHQSATTPAADPYIAPSRLAIGERPTVVVPQDEDPLQDPVQGPRHDPRTDTEK